LVPGFKIFYSCEHITPPNCPHCLFAARDVALALFVADLNVALVVPPQR
jgi:hypothetical protein